MVLRPPEQPGLHGGDVVGPARARARPRMGESMSKRPRRSTSSRLRRTRLPASSAVAGTGRSSTRASTPSPTGKSSTPMRRRAVALASSRSACAESTAWSRLTVDMALLRPTSADWTATCSMRRGRPPVALEQAAYLVRLRREVDLLASGRADAAQEQLDGRTLQRRAAARAPAAARRGRRPRRLAGRGPRGDDDAGVGGALQQRLEHRTGAGGVEVEAVEHEQALAPVDRPPERTGEGVAGSRLGLEALAARRRARRRGCAGCGRRPTTRRVAAAACRTRSVFPLPGGPTTVTQRDSSRASPSARWTSPRPRQGDSTDELSLPRRRDT